MDITLVLMAAAILISRWIAGRYKAAADEIMVDKKCLSDEMKTDWVNKYKLPLEPIPTGLYGKYHEFVGARYKERYLFSASFFVSTTDRWHKYNSYRQYADMIPLLCLFFMSYSLISAILLSLTTISIFYLSFNIYHRKK